MKWFTGWYRFLVVGAVFLVFWFSSEHPIAAHAILVEAAPAANSTISGPDVEVKLRFNSRIDAARSRLALILPGGGQRKLELQPEESADRLSSSATGLAAGSYVLRWQVLASDGHITRGEIPFVVK